MAWGRPFGHQCFPLGKFSVCFLWGFIRSPRMAVTGSCHHSPGDYDAKQKILGWKIWWRMAIQGALLKGNCAAITGYFLVETRREEEVVEIVVV
ncbi:hypothetical protein RRG08_044401 [Elysia crispata]|uniref:Uncharacterized protein n=1 Tax=Elysia crispata TaxID=231223 RepID=A0AAE0ZVA1_9GAST|nr:hypothetical protein RRG08_044401 [Elysia crispata]